MRPRHQDQRHDIKRHAHGLAAKLAHVDGVGAIKLNAQNAPAQHEENECDYHPEAGHRSLLKQQSITRGDRKSEEERAHDGANSSHGGWFRQRDPEACNCGGGIKQK